jgi:hypothetical protein
MEKNWLANDQVEPTLAGPPAATALTVAFPIGPFGMRTMQSLCHTKSNS